MTISFVCLKIVSVYYNITFFYCINIYDFCITTLSVLIILILFLETQTIFEPTFFLFKQSVPSHSQIQSITVGYRWTSSLRNKTSLFVDFIWTTLPLILLYLRSSLRSGWKERLVLDAKSAAFEKEVLTQCIDTLNRFSLLISIIYLYYILVSARDFVCVDFRIRSRAKLKMSK